MVFNGEKEEPTIIDGFTNHDDILERLGKHKLGKSCLYINKLEDVDISVLKELIAESMKHVKTLDINY